LGCIPTSRDNRITGFLRVSIGGQEFESIADYFLQATIGPCHGLQKNYYPFCRVCEFECGIPEIAPF